MVDLCMFIASAKDICLSAFVCPCEQDY